MFNSKINPFRKSNSPTESKIIPWEEFNPKLREYYQNIKIKNLKDERVKKHFETIRKGNIRNLNTVLSNRTKNILPEIKMTQRFVEQARYAAVKASQKYNTPLEVSGVCTGRKNKNNIILDQYSIFHNQSCSAIHTQAQGFGMIQTYHELRRKRMNAFAQAHSHNVMKTFHSQTDIELLKQGIEESPMNLESKVDNISVPIQCFYNVVFNHNTNLNSVQRDEPHVRVSYKIPKATIQGQWDSSTPIQITEPRWKMLQYKEMTEEDMKRLDNEIKERVSYAN